MFADYFMGMPPKRHLEFMNDVVLGVALIAKATYNLTPRKMQELSILIHELLDKEFIG